MAPASPSCCFSSVGCTWVLGTLALRQADWLLGYFTGRYGVSDKPGLDPRTVGWPRWLSRLELAPVELPRAVAPGTGLGRVSATAARATGLLEHTLVLAGTTDSTAEVVAAGAVRPGDSVTCLGSTLVFKIIGREPIAAPQYGVYSHRFGAQLADRRGIQHRWGGAATLLRRWGNPTAEHNSGPGSAYGTRLLSVAGPRRTLSHQRWRTPTTRLSPRPADDGRFSQGLLGGIARIGASGYRRLRMLGAPSPRLVLTTGGGATNAGWTEIRKRCLGILVTPAKQ